MLITHTHFSLDSLSPHPICVPWHCTGYLGENQSNLWIFFLYSHSGAHSSPCCFCAVDANAHLSLLNFAVVLFLQLGAEDKRGTQSLCGVMQMAQPDCGSLASFLCLWELQPALVLSADSIYFFLPSAASNAWAINALWIHSQHSSAHSARHLELSAIWPPPHSGPGSVGRFHYTPWCLYVATQMDTPNPDVDNSLLPWLQMFSSDSICK